MKNDILITAIFKSGDPAATAIAALLSGGISNKDINIVTSEQSDVEAFDIQKRSMVGEGAAVGGGIGGALGAIIAGLTAIGSISTGGVGLLVAGPIVAALAGAGAGAAAGGAVGALIGLGVPQHQVRFVAEAIEKGAVLVGVRTPAERRDWVERTLKYYSAESLTVSSLSTTGAAGDRAEATDAQGAVDGGLRELLTDQLKDMYFAEKTVLELLSEMHEAASSPTVAAAFSEHLEETRGHITRLERVFESVGTMPQAQNCPAMSGIVSEAQELMKLDRSTAQRDAALICAAQKVAHYEIATYGCMLSFARTLGLETATELLAQTLAEEKHANRRLSLLAENGINQSAAGLAAMVMAPGAGREVDYVMPPY